MSNTNNPLGNTVAARTGPGGAGNLSSTPSTFQELTKVAETALARGSQALQNTQSLGFPITGKLVDSTVLGSGYVRVGVWISAGTAQTTIPIQLGRVPSGIVIVDNNTGAVVYRTAADVAASGPTAYVCRATAGVSITAIIV